MLSRLSGVVLTLTLGVFTGAETTTIYRHEDAHGITVFADRPGADPREVELASVNTYQAVEPKEPAAPVAPEKTAAGYQTLIITSPGDGETIRRNGGNLRVTGRVEPELRRNHRAALYVDGTVATSHHPMREPARAPSQPRGDMEFALEGLARGPHALRIAISDRENNILVQSAPVRFHLLRTAVGLR